MYKFVILIISILLTINTFSQVNSNIKNPQLNNVLQLNISGNGYQDNIFIAYMNGATFGYDGQFDVVKLYGIYQAPQFFSIIPGNINLSINTLPDITYYNIVQLGLYVGKDTTYNITSTGTNSFTNYSSIILEDTKINVNTELMQQPFYSFLGSTSDSVTRFRLHFSNPTHISNNVEDGIVILNSNKRIIIISLNNELLKKVEIIGVKGDNLFNKTYNNQKKIEIETVFPSGFYLIKVLTTEKTYIKKIQII